MIRILIAERDAAVASLLEVVARQLPDCHITVAHDSDATVEALNTETFDVVLLDVGLYSDGLETLRSVRGRNSGCEVIALTTGAISAPLLKTLAKADVFAVLMKPFDAKQLEGVLRESVRPERVADPNRPLVYRNFGREPTHE
ncbi:MAG TPA: response regulator [Gemmatimonadaceae bacterium]|nr:response regulator [Gemmatimonadaceae bacterium]